MKAFVTLLGSALFATALSASDQSNRSAKPEARVPVLLELFTSEGCSSCPPADRLLQKLDHDQPLEGADLIVISEHVDYWNRLGWVDKSSSHFFSQRQEEYATRLHSQDIYTPQLLIDGSVQVIGSDRARVEHAIRSVLNEPKVAFSVDARRNGETATIKISTELPERIAPADLFLVLAADRVSSVVTAGENSGSHLTHTSVAYSFKQVGALQGKAYAHQIDVALPAGAEPGKTRVIVFAQDRKTGRIAGAAQTNL